MSQVFATKGNLISTKKLLELARRGYELMDRKRNILIRETLSLIDRANEVQSAIDRTYSEAYRALQIANITLGVVDDLAKMVPEEQGVQLDYRSVMGVEIPIARLDEAPVRNHYGYFGTSSELDEAYIKFEQVKRLTVDLAQLENTVYRLAEAIKKTQKRANALRNIIIPRLEEDVAFITKALAEKEREEFSRLKVIKKGRETPAS